MSTFIVEGESQTIKSVDGRVLFFCLNDFKKYVVKGNCCFICGASPDIKEFNDEHIIPDWILKKYNLHNKRITLPNGASVMYGTYKVPCCQECNSLLGRDVEEPISRLLTKSYPEVIQEIDKRPEAVHDIFRWLCLIYLKTHLKDKSYQLNLDRRVDAGTIADQHEWEEIHHIYTMARVPYTKPFIDLRVYGTIFIVPVLLTEGEQQFDYFDTVIGKTVVLQLGQFCIIATLNDSCAGYSFYGSTLKKITAPLTRLQIREIATHLFYVNVHLKYRPLFFSTISENGYEIGVELPETLELVSKDEEALSFGEVMYRFVKEILPQNVDEELVKNIKAGRWTFMFNEKEEFIDNRKSSSCP
jgi:hypothetical protein